MEPATCLPELEIVKRFQDGYTYQQLAEEYRVSRGTIWRIIKNTTPSVIRS
jgi:Mor family transcriptional regulator